MTLPTFPMRPGVDCPDWSVVRSPVVKDALITLFETEHLLNRWNGFTPQEDDLRMTVLWLFADRGRAPTIDELSTQSGAGEPAIRALLTKLKQRDLVVLDETGERIVGAYPFTDRDSRHQVRVGARRLNAMCAVDALGIGAMLDHDVEVNANCHGCGAPIRITTRDRGQALSEIRPESTVAWLGLQYNGGCAANSLCTVTTFFCSSDHLEAWRAAQPRSRGVKLSASEALEAGTALFGPSLRSREEFS